MQQRDEAPASSPSRDEPAFSAPYTTDVPQCCGEPETCPDPCPDPRDAEIERLRAELATQPEPEPTLAWVRRLGANSGHFVSNEACQDFATQLEERLPAAGRLPCGHPSELLLTSAETGEPLYCELCDDKSGRRDAERMEQELRAERDHLRAELAARPVQQWQPIETAPQNRKVIVSYLNSHAKRRTVMACYYPANTLTLEDMDSDEDYAPEGWYEQVENSETIHRLEYAPTHWMPLPAAPEPAKGE